MPTVEAQIVGVVEKPSGWTRIETDSRPQFLDTKREDLIEEARGLMRSGVVAIIEYSERDGRNTNPNTGQPYKDRYYEGARTASSNGSSRAEPEPEREPRHQYENPAVVAWRIALSVGAKLAVQTLPLMPVEQRDFETQKKIALAWALWVVNTPKPAQGFGEESSSRETRARGAYDEPPPPDEEFGF